MNATTTIAAAATVLLLSALLAGCVTAPADVPPTFVDQRNYLNRSCDELRELRIEGEAAVAALSQKQTSARRRSIAYNWLLVVGSGALTKDRSEALGRAKGELLAIKSAEAQNCGSRAEGSAG